MILSGARQLSQLDVGALATVHTLSSEDDANVRRLAELGLTPGADITVMQRGRGAIVVATRNSRIAIGTSLAESVLVIAGPDERAA